ncbi:MAG: hypothetical protein QW815_04430 [Nitrososphaerota archaeon]
MIGSAHALGEISLAVFLILGFTIHNTTEGLAIIAPATGSRIRLLHLFPLGIIAGAPTIFGTWVGGFSYLAFSGVLFLAVGAGAIFQVMYEVLKYMRSGDGLVRTISSPANLAGITIGLLVMYFTGLLVS